MPDPSNPFNAICSYCGTKISVHWFKGRKAVCEDGYADGFELWQVVDAKRALGHRINAALSHAAMVSKTQK